MNVSVIVSYNSAWATARELWSPSMTTKYAMGNVYLFFTAVSSYRVTDK